jgi:hypothetical protein
VTDVVQQGVKVVAKQSQQAQAEGGQSSQTPNAGPNQYGDQSIVNSSTESTNQRGKAGQGQGQEGAQQGNQKNGNQGAEQKGGDQKAKEKQRKELKKQQSGSSH